MARKYDFISELYNRTCKTVVANPASWEAFLRSACYNYRLRFDEQLLVHAQRPDATAVLPTRIQAAFPAEFPFGKCGTNTRQK